MEKRNFSRMYMDRHRLIIKQKEGTITSDEISQLEYLNRYFNQMLHRMRA